MHAYGVPKILESIEQRIAILELSFEHFDPSYTAQWKTLPDDYRTRLLNGIVAFEIAITNLEGKFKLSQNRTEGDRLRIIESLSGSSEGAKKEVAKYMEERKAEKPK